MKIFLAIFLFVHGFAHLVGFMIPWKIAKLEEMPYSTSIFFNKINLGHVGIRIVGILWLVAALAYFYSFYMTGIQERYLNRNTVFLFKKLQIL